MIKMMLSLSSYHLVRRMSSITIPSTSSRPGTFQRIKELMQMQKEMEKEMEKDKEKEKEKRVDPENARMFDDALELYRKNQQPGTRTALSAFHDLVYKARANRLFDRIPHLFDELPLRYGFQPCLFSYYWLMDAHCKTGHPELAAKVMEEIHVPDKDSSFFTFSGTLFIALCKAGKIQEAERFWYKMRVKRRPLYWDAWYVRIALTDNGCAETKEWNDSIRHAHMPLHAEQLIQEMGLHGLKPNTATYHQLLLHYFFDRGHDEALKLLDKLEAGGFRPTAAVFETLIYYLCSIRDYNTGYDLFKRSIKYNEMPHFTTLRDLAEGRTRKKIKDAKDLISTVNKYFPPDESISWEKVEAKLDFVPDETLVIPGTPLPEDCKRMQSFYETCFINGCGKYH